VPLCFAARSRLFGMITYRACALGRLARLVLARPEAVPLKP
jgi:hypothetical protein